jgi:hypothetical protein
MKRLLMQKKMLESGQGIAYREKIILLTIDLI